MRIPFFPRKRGRGRRQKQSWLKPETKRAIIGVLLVLLAVLSFLSFIGAAGPTGRYILQFLRMVFGWLGFVAPFVIGVLGVYLVRPFGEGLPRLKIVGMLLLAVGLLGIFHLVGVAPEDAYQVAIEGKGGGLLGFTLTFPLSKALSAIGSFVVWLAAALVGAFMTFNLSPGEVLRYLSWLWPQRKETYEDDTDEAGRDEVEEEGTSGAGVPTFRVSRTRLLNSSPDPNQLQLQQKERQREQLKAANRRYKPPSLDLLHSSTSKPNSGNVEENKRKIKETLENFGILVAMGKVSVGPTVTQYTLRPEEGIKLARITSLQNDLALALAAHPLRIEAPIPNTNLVGIEIPNKDVSIVRLRDLIGSKIFRQADSPLTLTFGKDVAGSVVIDTLERMPHLLIAGATGSGKSIFINTLLMSLLYHNSPALVRLILVDPKRVELSVYNNIPHLLTPVIVEPEKTINALKWAVREMDKRYKILSEAGTRNIMSFNANNPNEAMPMIVIIIDELADLMARHARDVEGAIVRLSQMARAIGIHLVLATQRPSVNVITGLIKANIPTRVAFNVASQVDSRTILDASGAEKLLGSGDMLYLRGDRAKPIRIQGGFISDEEVHQVVKEIVENNPTEDMEYDDSIVSKETAESAVGGEMDSDDDLFAEAKNLVIETGKASSSLLQRRLRIGYARAARLIDVLEEQGVIGPAEGNKPREILLRAEGGGKGAAGKEEEYDDRDTFAES